LSKPLSKLVILNRDGVINQGSDQCIRSPEEWLPIPGSLQAIARLNQAGYRVAVATNQSAVSSGLLDLDALNATHRKLHDLLDRIGGHVDVIAYCPHRADDDCECRKPRPGMYRQLAERFNLELAGIPVIGDSRSDLETALAVGARPMLVRTGKGAATEQVLGELGGDIEVYDDLAHAVSALLIEE
jgi:D-glycero-D-manno-heptose 1,7-bisphosphate phosphatase